MNKENLEDEGAFHMNLHMDNTWLVRENGKSRKQEKNIPGGYSGNLMLTGNRRYGLE